MRSWFPCASNPSCATKLNKFTPGPSDLHIVQKVHNAFYWQNYFLCRQTGKTIQFCSPWATLCPMDSVILSTRANRTMKYSLKALKNEERRRKLQYPTSWIVLKRSDKIMLHQKHFKKTTHSDRSCEIGIRPRRIFEAPGFSPVFSQIIWNLNMSSDRHVSKVLNCVNPWRDIMLPLTQCN